MLCVDSQSSYDFETSCEEIKGIHGDIENYILRESRAQLKKILDQPRFYEHHQSYCQAFSSEEEREKGLLTRIMEKDPALLAMDGSESMDKENEQANLNKRL